jgi:hypothetical protein
MLRHVRIDAAPGHASGFSEAAVAAHAIFGVVHPDRVPYCDYSTTQGVPVA